MSPTDEPPEEPLTLGEIREGWSLFDGEERRDAFRQLVRVDAEDFFLDLSAPEQAEVAALTSGLPYGAGVNSTSVPPQPAAMFSSRSHSASSTARPQRSFVALHSAPYRHSASGAGGSHSAGS